MALDFARTATAGELLRIVESLVANDGSAAHAHVRGLMRPNADPRDLADAVHLLCSLHGRHPGLLEHAAEHDEPAAARDWLAQIAARFADERAELVRLAVAAGPQPSTPGQAETEAAVAGQHHALDMLARSSRTACALGAAAALVIDWAGITPLLSTAARRFGLDPVPAFSFDEAEFATLLGAVGGAPAIDRAILFGTEQLLAQHRGLWDLLDARAAARAKG